MFKEEEKKLEQRKIVIGQVEVSKDKLHSAVRRGFEQAKQERVKKRTKIIKRSSWSIAAAAILLIAFTTSVSVSPAFASKVASIPGLEHIVALVQQDRGLSAAVENDFYQPLNLSQEKNGITVTLDGVIADKKGMVVFYTVASEKMDVSSLELNYLQLWSGMEIRNNHKFMKAGVPLTPNSGSNGFSSTEHFDKVMNRNDLSWQIGLKNGEQIEHFNIPFTYETMEVERKNIVVNKDVEVEGQQFTVKELIVDPIRTIITIEENPNNTKKLLARPFDELELVDEQGRKWPAMPGNAYKTGLTWEVPLKESFYFYNPKSLNLSFGKIAAMDKDEAHIVIDTVTATFIEQPSKSNFSNLQVEDNRVSFTVKVDENYDPNMVNFLKFTDADGKEFLIHYGGATPTTYHKVNGSKTISPGEVKIEFELPNKSFDSFANPIQLDLDFYPSWIEDDVEVKIKN